MIKIRVEKILQFEKDGEIKNKSVGFFEHTIMKEDVKEIELIKAILETITKSI